MRPTGRPTKGQITVRIGLEAVDSLFLPHLNLGDLSDFGVKTPQIFNAKGGTAECGNVDAL